MAKQIHLIIPCAGKGSRFQTNGDFCPKPLKELYGRPFFYWAATSAMSCFNDAKFDMTFVVLNEHIISYDIDKKILEFFPDANIVGLPFITSGPVVTALNAVIRIDDDNAILIQDCDHAMTVEKRISEINSDAAVFSFESNSNNYSYLIYGDNGEFVRTVEKDASQSNHAIFGCYYFKNRETFEHAANEYLRNSTDKESYMSGVLNYVASLKRIDVKDHYEFGTPEELKELLDSNKMNPNRLKGNSGCELSISDGIVTKKAGEKYYQRLMQQSAKQLCFPFVIIDGVQINTPNIIGNQYKDKSYEFSMPYIHGDTLAELIKYDKNAIRFADTLAKFIFEHNSKTATYYDVRDKVLKKIDSIEPYISDKELQEGLNYLREHINIFSNIPLSYCHGDLTLENIIVTKDNELYLIDFLDSFVNSYLVDAATVLQDSLCCWSYRNQILSDVEIENVNNFNKAFCSKIPIVEVNTIFWFLYLKLYRILPYAKDNDTVQFLKQNILMIKEVCL